MISILMPAYNIEVDTRPLTDFCNNHDCEVIVQEDYLGEGKGITLQNAFMKSKGDIIIWYDADYEIPVYNLERFLWMMNIYNVDVVIGTKLHPISNVHYPPMRKTLTYLASRFIKFLFRLPINDTQTGLKVFKRKVLEGKWRLKRFGHDIEVLYWANKRGFKIFEVPVDINKRKGSSVTWKAIGNTFLEVMYLRIVTLLPKRA